MSKELNIFEVATRKKYRFPYKGYVSTEDLWDISLEGLDSIYKTLNQAVKRSKEESLLETKSAEDETLENQIAILKYIVEVKKQEAYDKVMEKERREKRQRILEIKAKRSDAALENASDSELDAMLEELA